MKKFLLVGVSMVFASGISFGDEVHLGYCANKINEYFQFISQSESTPMLAVKNGKIENKNSKKILDFRTTANENSYRYKINDQQSLLLKISRNADGNYVITSKEEVSNLSQDLVNSSKDKSKLPNDKSMPTMDEQAKKFAQLAPELETPAGSKYLFINDQVNQKCVFAQQSVLNRMANGHIKEKIVFDDKYCDQLQKSEVADKKLSPQIHQNNLAKIGNDRRAEIIAEAGKPTPNIDIEASSCSSGLYHYSEETKRLAKQRVDGHPATWQDTDGDDQPPKAGATGEP